MRAGRLLLPLRETGLIQGAFGIPDGKAGGRTIRRDECLSRILGRLATQLRLGSDRLRVVDKDTIARLPRRVGAVQAPLTLVVVKPRFDEVPRTVQPFRPSVGRANLLVKQLDRAGTPVPW